MPSLSTETSDTTLKLVLETEFNKAVVPTPAASILIRPALPSVDIRLANPLNVQAPPVSAVPHELVVVRAYPSAARIGSPAFTCLVMVSVAPSLSVTVSVTENHPLPA